MKCRCGFNLVNVYVADKETKNKEPIGKICFHCDLVRVPTEYFQKLKKEKHQQKEDQNKMPQFSAFNERCDKCPSKRYWKRKFPPKKVKYKQSDGSWGEQLNNPYIRYTCRRCNNVWRVSLPMPYPIPKKYLKSILSN